MTRSNSFLSTEDLADLRAFRHHLHRNPELACEEARTARDVVARLARLGPDRIVEGLGGHGVAAVFEGSAPGPTALFRAELDALPIQETGDVPHRSLVPGKAHLCGHDGHTATLLALGLGLSRQRPRRGRAVLMFQPAEENGVGAAAVVADPKFTAIQPNISFSWHNVPGLPLGLGNIAAGPVNCASRGMRIRFSGKTAHASQPETGLSPVPAVAELMPALIALSTGTTLDRSFRMVTVTHCRIGERAFGISPGEAEVLATLRTLVDDTMLGLVEAAEACVREVASRHSLTVDIGYEDVFAHVENAPEAVTWLRRAFEAEGLPMTADGLPFRASEDFGRFGHNAPSAMVFIGAGETRPSLHNPDYDFPDDLIDIGARIMLRVARDVLG